MKNIYDRLPAKIIKSKNAVDLLETNHLFTGVGYNHSVLGAIEDRRKFMPFASFNPAKTLVSTAQQFSRVLDAQQKVIHTMLDSTAHGLNNYWGDGEHQMNTEQMVEFVSTRKNGVRVVFLAEDKTLGYKVKAVHVGSAKDLAFAKSVNAVVISEDSYRQAISIVNTTRINNHVIELFDRFAVMPLKLGYLMSAGFLVRNFIDSNMKNLISAGSFNMAPHTLETFQMYMKYKNIIRDLIEMGGVHARNIEVYFSKGGKTLDKEMFVMFQNLLNTGVGSITRELEEHFGNVYTLLQKRLRSAIPGTESIDASDIRKFIHGDVTGEEAMILARFDGNQDVLKEMNRIKNEFKQYKKGYAMYKHAKQSDFTLDEIVTYLKSPNKVPAEKINKYMDLLKYDATETIADKTFDAMRNNSIVQGFFDINNDLENVVRLSHYTYHIKYSGFSARSAYKSTLDTHFDYKTKNKAQLYAELIFPFITFTTNNTAYWIRAIQTNPKTMGVLRDHLMEHSGVKDYDEWDIQNRLSLQYHIQSGNMILDKETGLSLKINPSIMDAINIMLMPKETLLGDVGREDGALGGRLNAWFQTVPALLQGYDEDSWMDEEEYERRRNLKILNLVPFAGAFANRMISGWNNANKTGSNLQRVLPGILGRVSYPQEKNFKPYTPYAYKSYNNNYTPYVKRTYTSMKAYNTVAYAKYGYAFDYRSTKAFKDVLDAGRRSWATIHTAKGKNKMELLLLPTNTSNRAWKMAMISRL